MTRSGWKRAVLGAVLAAGLAGPAAADEAEARAALEASVTAQSGVLDVLAEIDGPEALDARTPDLEAALDAAVRADTAMMPHVPEINSSAALEAEFAPRMQALYARRAEVQAGLRDALDEASLARLLVLLNGVE